MIKYFEKKKEIFAKTTESNEDIDANPESDGKSDEILKEDDQKGNENTFKCSPANPTQDKGTEDEILISSEQPTSLTVSNSKSILAMKVNKPLKDMQTQIMLFWLCTRLNRKSCHRSLVVLIIVKSVYYDICIV